MLPLMFALFQQVSLIAPLANLLAMLVFDLLMVPAGTRRPGVPQFSACVGGADAVRELAAGLLARSSGRCSRMARAALPARTRWTRPALPGWELVCAGVGVVWLIGAAWLARRVGSVRCGCCRWRCCDRRRLPPSEAWFTLLDCRPGVVGGGAYRLAYANVRRRSTVGCVRHRTHRGRAVLAHPGRGACGCFCCQSRRQRSHQWR